MRVDTAGDLLCLYASGETYHCQRVGQRTTIITGTTIYIVHDVIYYGL